MTEDELWLLDVGGEISFDGFERFMPRKQNPDDLKLL
jgi:hypothetical protein